MSWGYYNQYYPPDKSYNYNNYYNNYNHPYYNYYYDKHYNKFDNDYYEYNDYNYGNKRWKNFPRKRYIEVEVNDDNTTKIEEEFIEELKNIGYYIKEVKGDGNCLFRSVSEQIEGNEDNFKKYRETCIDYMLQNINEFIPFLDEDEDANKYIEKMNKDGEWGGNLEIYALSKALKANFYIYIYKQPCYIVKNWDNPEKNIFLTYHNGKHYNSLKKIEGKNNKELDEEKENDQIKIEDRKDNNEEEKEEGKEKDKEEGNKEENKSKENDDKNNSNSLNDFLSKVNHLNI